MKPMEDAVRQFVPMNDDLLYRSDALPGPLVPYRCGLPCWHQLQTETRTSGADAAQPTPAAGKAREADAVTA